MGEGLAVGGGEAAAHADGVAGAVDDAVDANLVRLRLDREAVAALDRDEIGKVGALHRQRVGETDTDLRRGAVRLDLVGDDAEPVLGHGLLVGGAKGRRLDQGEARAVGADRGLPVLLPRKRVTEDGQSAGLLRDRGGAEIGVDGGGRGIRPRVHAVGVAGRVQRKAGAGEGEPRRRIVVGDRQCLSEGGGGAVVLAGTGGDGAGVGEPAEARPAGGEPAVQVADQRPGGVDLALRQEIELGKPLPLQRRRQSHRGDDAPGDGIGGRAQSAEVRLEEAPAGLGVEREGVAGVVGEARRLALIDTGVLDGADVVAGVVRLWREDHAPVGSDGTAGHRRRGHQHGRDA